jgi:cell division protein FtsW (lipid II flippase)
MRAKQSFITRYLGPTIPWVLALFGLWILYSGSYAFRPTRSLSREVLLPPDSWGAAIFFIFLGLVLAAFDLKGRSERYAFWIGLVGCIGAVVFVGYRQITGTAVHG